MRLRELEAHFLFWYSEIGTRNFVNDPAVGLASGTHTVMGPIDYFKPVETLAEAHGIRFLCPAAFAKRGGPVGTHSIQVFFTGSPVPPHIGTNSAGVPVRWTASGTDLDDLTLTPSIQEVDDGLCSWHGFVTGGDAK